MQHRLLSKLLRLVVLTVVPLFFVASLSAEGERVAASAEEVEPILVGSPVPSVTVQRIDGSEVDLAKLAQEKPTVFVFYRGGW